jgi:hypothetical protein
MNDASTNVKILFFVKSLEQLSYEWKSTVTRHLNGFSSEPIKKTMETQIIQSHAMLEYCTASAVKAQTHDATLRTTFPVIAKLLSVSTFKIVVRNLADDHAKVGSSSTSATSRAMLHRVSAPSVSHLYEIRSIAISGSFLLKSVYLIRLVIYTVYILDTSVPYTCNVPYTRD